MEFVKQNLKYIGIAGCVLAIIGCLLPFATVSALSISQSISYIQGTDGKIFLIVFVISAVLLFLNKEKFSLIATAIGAGIFAYGVINVNNSVAGGLGSLVKFSYGVGFYLTLIGIVIALACTIIKNIKK